MDNVEDSGFDSDPKTATQNDPLQDMVCIFYLFPVTCVCFVRFLMCGSLHQMGPVSVKAARQLVNDILRTDGRKVLLGVAFFRTVLLDMYVVIYDRTVLQQPNCEMYLTF